MKTTLGYMAILLFVALAYWSDVFSLFAHKGALILAAVLVVAVFAIAIRILGNPLHGEENDDDEKK